jgi:hypothetical protein
MEKLFGNSKVIDNTRMIEKTILGLLLLNDLKVL